ncbi:MAG: DUF5684 domain-containing protein [Bacilli bacterium]|nr:DUF5684 domain-containing protein [Bacilli bacterium]
MEFTSYTSTVDTSVLKVIFGFISAYLMIFLVIGAFVTICWWKIFKKAGKKGWESIVPIYNMYIIMQITNNPIWIMILALVVPGFGMLAYTILVAMNMAKAFGKDTGFAFLIFFVPIIALPILAFGKDTYRFPSPIINQ